MARQPLDQARVVDAAAAMADADGLPATTLSALARELGVRTPSLYKHVDSLPALHHLVALRAIDELTQAVTEAATGRSGPEAVRAAANAWRAFAHAHPGRYAAIAPFTPPAEGGEEYRAAAARLITVLHGVLRAWSLEDDEAIDAIRGLRAAIHGYVAIERSGGFALARPVDASFQRMIDSLIAGLGDPA
jgi:AcrR family transcriptional regulator